MDGEFPAGGGLQGYFAQGCAEGGEEFLGVVGCAQKPAALGAVWEGVRWGRKGKRQWRDFTCDCQDSLIP